MKRSDNEYAEAIRFLLDRINYEKSSNRPYNQQNFRLARMAALLERLGNPQLAAPVVHVAGSKGKGSVSWFIAEAARHAGYQVGLYTSPHLEFLEERFVIDGQIIQPSELVSAVGELKSHLPLGCLGEHGEPTFFEMTTAMAWLLFRNRNTKLNVIEVGLGGRLDSTNVCDSNISVITSISFDHQAQLGNTIALIAREKAGIIKPNQSVVSGARHPDAREVIREVAKEKKCNIWEIGRDFECLPTTDSVPTTDSAIPSSDSAMPHPSRLQFHSSSSVPGLKSLKDVEVKMLGSHQLDNSSIAIAACQRLNHMGWNIPESAIRASLSGTQVPCRVEVVRTKPVIILDTAHNIASVTSLVDTLKKSFAPRRKTILFACSKDKEYEAMLEILMGYADRIVLTQYLSNPRFVPVERLASIARTMHGRFPNVEVLSASDPDLGLQYALQKLDEQDLLTCTGSFFLAAELRPKLAAGTI